MLYAYFSASEVSPGLDTQACPRSACLYQLLIQIDHRWMLETQTGPANARETGHLPDSFNQAKNASVASEPTGFMACSANQTLPRQSPFCLLHLIMYPEAVHLGCYLTNHLFQMLQHLLQETHLSRMATPYH